MRAGGQMDRTIPYDPVQAFSQPPYVDECVALLAQAPLAGEQALAERLSQYSRRMPETTICRAAERALRTLDVDRFALVNPPWFDDELDAAGGAYFAGLGFEVVHHVPCGLPSGQPHITPPALLG